MIQVRSIVRLVLVILVLLLAVPPSITRGGSDSEPLAGWSLTGSMETRRHGHTATLLPDGRVLVVGGQDIEGNVLAGAEVYDPIAGTWTYTGPLSTGRYAHTATLLANGQVLVIGGQDSGDFSLTSAEIYDPATGAWTPTGSLAILRCRHTATLLPDGRVLVAGGYYWADPGDQSLDSAEVYDPATGTWTPTGSLWAARHDHTATLLPDGRVLATGGYNGANALATAEIYNPATGTWTPTGSLQTARHGHTATLLPDGRVLAAGGYANGSSLASAELYGPADETWSPAGALAAARHAHTATLLPDGRVLAAGGVASDYLASAEVYDPASNGWSAAGTMQTARAGHTATLLSSGRMLVAGGRNSDVVFDSAELYEAAAGGWSATGPMAAACLVHTATLLPSGAVVVAGGLCNGLYSDDAELYDPATGTWRYTGSMSTAHGGHTATQLRDGRVLLAAGPYYSDSAEIYDPSTETWSETGSLHINRAGHGAVLLADGRVLVAGGYTYDGSQGFDLASAELYDPAAGTWSDTGAMNQARERQSMTRLPDGRVLVTGGECYESGSLQILDSAELYDPATGTWSETDPLSVARDNHTATLLPGGQVLVAGGYDEDGIALASAELYDPAAGTWSAVGPLGHARYYHTATLLPDGRVLVAGGFAATNAVIDSAEVYDPAKRAWSEAGALSVARAVHTATLLSNGRVLIAGGRDASAPLASAELYDPGPGFDPTWRPFLLDTLTSPLILGCPLVATGTGFRGHQFTEASGGDTASSATNYPLVQIRQLANDQTFWLRPDPARSFSASTFTSVPILDLPLGQALVTVFVNGIPSVSRAIAIDRPANGPPAAQDDVYATHQDTVLVVTAPGVLSNDPDYHCDPISATLITEPASGTLALRPDGSFIYTPTLGAYGLDGFDYQACDDASPPACSNASVTLAIGRYAAYLPLLLRASNQ